MTETTLIDPMDFKVRTNQTPNDFYTSRRRVALLDYLRPDFHEANLTWRTIEGKDILDSFDSAIWAASQGKSDAFCERR